ncbi:uncharacterized protein PHACADRAFT_255999 [Phanerochaete carnosa HHB-10118-sp]|uniref:AB hydrolase-1 domain-containing protein n=1 Tax=Phanerochaete carnosa (strain HHB-10118-sp) TaxID=650164 RepID=K5UZ16_PHACS|nr:uncharacterized protein PHACADRAFT_255999 [Phanerochaete carnosa HHB-10118-sp]EKM55396.1 hypothetical protein PHACADRAFT_255999 [Phanerochaete carnosa HHB-10118-sp]
MKPLFSNVALFLLSLTQAQAAVRRSIPSQPTVGTFHRRTYFYAGGEFAPQSPSVISHGQVYVEHLVPEKVTQPLPLLMVHGMGMTATNFLNTPDGRVGWADHFMSKGWEVYLIDQPSRGRSPWSESTDGDVVLLDTETVSAHFTAPQDFDLWPQAALHTQWPGNGTRGDPVFDEFFKSMVQYLNSTSQSEVELQAAATDLLNKTGPVVLLTHSQGGPMGWVLADANPANVHAILAIEPGGPPFVDAVLDTAPDNVWGVTNISISYSPPVASPSDLQPTVVFTDPSVSFTCFQQGTNPPRKLANLVDIPVLMVTSQASYHAVYDNCTAAYLQQAGVSVDHVHLEDVGITGNGHMMFMELNNIEIAEKVLEPWLAKTIH